MTFMGMCLTLFLAGLLAGHAARFDAGDKEHKEKVQHQEEARNVEGMKLQRLRGFNETGLKMLLADPTVPLEASGFLEEEAVGLPSPWNRQLKVVQKLGEGTFGKVYKCQVLCDPQQFVTVKLIKDKSAMVQTEIRMLEKMRGVSEFCIASIGNPSYIDAPEGYWIMMPLMNHGELFDLILQCDKNAYCSRCVGGRRCWTGVNSAYTVPYILTLFHDVVAGVEAIYNQGMLHTDLKPQNVMMNCEGDRCFAAVIDLGLVCDRHKVNACGWQGTPTYIPAEVFDGSGASESAKRDSSRDVWALGVILYQLMYQALPPFYGDRDGRRVASYRPDTDANIPYPRTKVDQLVVDMLSAYWNRPSLKRIMLKVEEIILTDYRDQNAYHNTQATATTRRATSPPPQCLTHPYATTTRPYVPYVSGAAGGAAGRRPAPAPAKPVETAMYPPYTKDVGYKQTKRRYCMDKPVTTHNGHCPHHLGDPTYCCLCHMKRHGRIVEEHFRMNHCY